LVGGIGESGFGFSRRKGGSPQSIVVGERRTIEMRPPEGNSMIVVRYGNYNFFL
jgi:hypothetical protein